MNLSQEPYIVTVLENPTLAKQARFRAETWQYKPVNLVNMAILAYKLSNIFILIIFFNSN